MSRGDAVTLSVALFSAHSVVTYDKVALKRFAGEIISKPGIPLNVLEAAQRALRW